jgi:hypothetical protein
LEAQLAIRELLGYDFVVQALGKASWYQELDGGAAHRRCPAPPQRKDAVVNIAALRHSAVSAHAWEAEPALEAAEGVPGVASAGREAYLGAR